MAIDYWQIFEEGNVYHIYNRSLQGVDLFKDEDDYFFFLSKYKEYLSPYISTYAYCLIPNHFHILVKVKALNNSRILLLSENTKASRKLLNGVFSFNDFLVDQMRRLFSSIALRYNNKYSRRGPLFTEKFKNIGIHSDSKLIYTLCYIHHNPIHHNLSKSMSKWKYSSFNAYLRDVESTLEKEIIITLFGGIQQFKEVHELFQIDYKNSHNLDP